MSSFWSNMSDRFPSRSSLREGLRLRCCRERERERERERGRGRKNKRENERERERERQR